MRDLMAELKELRLHGMATAWAELTAQGESNTASSKWLLEHLLEQEHTDRAMRSVSHQMNMAKLPMHRDLAGFDFSASSADARLISEAGQSGFTDTRAERGADRWAWHRQTHLATAPWPCPASPGTASACASTPRSIWSICWSAKSTTAKPGGSPRLCCVI
jgi:hypothetical protein